MFDKIATVLSGILLVTVPMFGDEWNKKTALTFSQPVEIPGVVLPAGQYVFKLLDSNADRHIVQVFNSEEDKIFATILAIPHYRPEPSSETVILFEERPSDRPMAIHAWFYPGNTIGQEFVYPKERALELARQTHQPVLTGVVKPTETPKELVETPVVAVTPDNTEVAISQVFELPTEPVPELGVTPVPAETAPAAPELPATASPLPFVALLGASAIAVGLILTAVRRFVI
jgi:hypothetical protein